jgi:hypothetical protein
MISRSIPVRTGLCGPAFLSDHPTLASATLAATLNALSPPAEVRRFYAPQEVT